MFEAISIDNAGGVTSKDSEGNPSLNPLNSWKGLTYNPENKRIVMENVRFIGDEQDVLDVTLKVKPTAQVGKTTVKLTDIRASNQAMISTHQIQVMKYHKMLKFHQQ